MKCLNNDSHPSSKHPFYVISIVQFRKFSWPKDWQLGDAWSRLILSLISSCLKKLNSASEVYTFEAWWKVHRPVVTQNISLVVGLRVPKEKQEKHFVSFFVLARCIVCSWTRKIRNLFSLFCWIEFKLCFLHNATTTTIKYLRKQHESSWFLALAFICPSEFSTSRKLPHSSFLPIRFFRLACKAR